jgi:hypothetical protein
MPLSQLCKENLQASAIISNFALVVSGKVSAGDFWLARIAILVIVLLQIGIVNDLAVDCVGSRSVWSLPFESHCQSPGFIDCLFLAFTNATAFSADCGQDKSQPPHQYRAANKSSCRLRL